MVTIHHSPVTKEHFPHQTPVAQELQAYEHILYHVLGLTSSDFCALQYSIFHDALESHQLYLFYIESKPQPMRPLRSRRKMLFRELRSRQLLSDWVWEEELKTGDGYSLLCAAIEGTRDNAPYLVKRHRRTPFSFGCILPQASSFSPARLLAELPGYLRFESGRTRLDVPKLLQRFSAPQAHLLHLPHDTDDKLLLSLYAHRQDTVFAKVLASIDEEFALAERN